MVKELSELTVSNLTVSKYLGIPNTKLNQLCQMGEFNAEARPGRGKKRALTFEDVLTLRITVELRRILGKELGTDLEVLGAAKKLTHRVLWEIHAGTSAEQAGVVQFSKEKLSVISDVSRDWLSPQDENSIDINKYLKKPYCAVTFFLLQPLFDEVVKAFEIVKAHSKQEKRRLKRQNNL